MTRRLFLALATFATSLFAGCDKSGPANKPRRECSTCKGSGRIKCMGCNGTGTTYHFKGPDLKKSDPHPCPSCKGKGAYKCSWCGGDGEM